MLCYFPLIESVIGIEANMYIALFTSPEWFHLNSKILYPIFSISAAPPRNDHSFGNSLISDVGRSQSDIIVDMGDIDKFGVLGAELAGP